MELNIYPQTFRRDIIHKSFAELPALDFLTSNSKTIANLHKPAQNGNRSEMKLTNWLTNSPRARDARNMQAAVKREDEANGR